MKTSLWILVKSPTVQLWPTKSDILEETVRPTYGCENLRVHTEEDPRVKESNHTQFQNQTKSRPTRDHVKTNPPTREKCQLINHIMINHCHMIDSY